MTAPSHGSRQHAAQMIPSQVRIASDDLAGDDVGSETQTEAARKAQAKLVLAANMLASLGAVPEGERGFVVRAAADYVVQTLRLLDHLDHLAPPRTVDLRSAAHRRGRHIAP